MRALVVVISLVLGAAVLILDPMGLWDDAIGKPTFDYSEADMRQAVEGSWELTLTRQLDGKPREARTVRFTIVQATKQFEQLGQRSRGLVRSANACGSRTLVRSAAACIPTSSMPLELVALDASSTKMHGQLMVIGASWFEARLDLRLGGELRVGAELDRHGKITNASANEGYQVAKLERIAR